ncbi:hypothetical protein, partial [Pseudomonas sp. UBA6310]|uniref:hypothetical protein n=1 Tax=Pseudomonas sp. UBA6310 TaxID=1947327 RepID=UPI00257B7156
AHNPKVVGSNPAPATTLVGTLETSESTKQKGLQRCRPFCFPLEKSRRSPTLPPPSSPTPTSAMPPDDPDDRNTVGRTVDG